MIIFDLDGTLADCEHRQHFVDPSKNSAYMKLSEGWFHKNEMLLSFPPQRKKFQPDWQAFYEACDQDKPIEPVIKMLLKCDQPYEIWSGRCESVREKTEAWIMKHIGLARFEMPEIKMRPIGDSTPDDVLKEKWLDEYISDMGNQWNHDIQFVFDDRPKVIRMWRRRGIFVFNCCQHNNEF